jgi:hypothetical protein
MDESPVIPSLDDTSTATVTIVEGKEEEEEEKSDDTIMYDESNEHPTNSPESEALLKIISNLTTSKLAQLIASYEKEPDMWDYKTKGPLARVRVHSPLMSLIEAVTGCPELKEKFPIQCNGKDFPVGTRSDGMEFYMSVPLMVIIPVLEYTFSKFALLTKITSGIVPEWVSEQSVPIMEKISLEFMTEEETIRFINNISKDKTHTAILLETYKESPKIFMRIMGVFCTMNLPVSEGMSRDKTFMDLASVVTDVDNLQDCDTIDDALGYNSTDRRKRRKGEKEKEEDTKGGGGGGDRYSSDATAATDGKIVGEDEGDDDADTADADTQTKKVIVDAIDKKLSIVSGNMNRLDTECTKLTHTVSCLISGILDKQSDFFIGQQGSGVFFLPLNDRIGLMSTYIANAMLMGLSMADPIDGDTKDLLHIIYGCICQTEMIKQQQQQQQQK